MDTRLWTVQGVTEKGTCVTVKEELPINLGRSDAFKAISSRYGFKKVLSGSPTTPTPVFKSSSSVKTKKWGERESYEDKEIGAATTDFLTSPFMKLCWKLCWNLIKWSFILLYKISISTYRFISNKKNQDKAKEIMNKTTSQIILFLKNIKKKSKTLLKSKKKLILKK